MNRYQKAEARAIKAMVRLYNCYGYDLAYKPVRRKVRKMYRALEKIRTAVISGTIPVSHELTRLLNEHKGAQFDFKTISKKGWYGANPRGVYLIDDKES